MGMKVWLVAALALGLFQPPLVRGEEPAPAGGEPGPRMVNDFEVADRDVAWGGNSTYEVVEDGDGKGGHAGRWKVEVGDKDPILYLRTTPADITPWSVVRFRMKRLSEEPQMVYLRIFTSDKDSFQVSVPGVSREWRLIEVYLQSMTERNAPNPKTVRSIAFGLVKGSSAEFLVDDVYLDHRLTPPTEEQEKREAERVWTIADFEDPSWADWVSTKASFLRTVKDGKSTVLEWKLQANASPASIYLHDLPVNLQERRTLRFRMRSADGPGMKISVRFMCGWEDCRLTDVDEPGKRWTEVQVPLALMEERGTFDLTRLECLSLQVYGGAACTIQLDDIRLERGATDAASLEKERFEYAFGKWPCRNK